MVDLVYLQKNILKLDMEEACFKQKDRLIQLPEFQDKVG